MVLTMIWVIAASGDETLPSLTYDVQPILDSYCVQCHMLEYGQAGLVLEDGEAHANLVNHASTGAPQMLRVAAGDLENSYLIHKLRGTHLTVGTGLGMPLVEGVYHPLEDAQLNIIEQWITNGARDN